MVTLQNVELQNDESQNIEKKSRITQTADTTKPRIAKRRLIC
jgi:hypothetical protein